MKGKEINISTKHNIAFNKEDAKYKCSRLNKTHKTLNKVHEQNITQTKTITKANPQHI